MGKRQIGCPDSLAEPDDNGRTSSRYCAPIYIAGMFGTFLASEEHLYAKDTKSLKIRNGTVTFIEYEGAVYGLTCRHVLRVLENAQRDYLRHYSEDLGQESVPEYALPGFWIPMNSHQWRVNSRFHAATGDEFVGDEPDVAIARIDPRLLSKIDRRPITFPKFPTAEMRNFADYGGIACGYPELARHEAESDREGFNRFVIPQCELYAFFEESRPPKVVLHSDELAETGEVNNFSGMSGGPILWTCSEDFGLLGIVEEAKDLRSQDLDDPDGPLRPPSILLYGTEISEEFLRSRLLPAIPEDDHFGELQAQSVDRDSEITLVGDSNSVKFMKDHLKHKREGTKPEPFWKKALE